MNREWLADPPTRGRYVLRSCNKYNGAMCSLDSNTVAAYAACVIAVMALFAAAVAIWQAHFTTRVQALLQLDSSWMSDAMRDARRKAASSLLKGETSVDVERVLDFFETIAGLFLKPHGILFFRSRVLYDHWTRHTFYWYAVCYWRKSLDHINAVRQRPRERGAWENLCDLMPRWEAAEGGAPTAGDIDEFLIGECASR